MEPGDDGVEDGSSTSDLAESSISAMKGLADETRIRTLLVLWNADDRPLGFSELRRRVGVADPGQFRYHLRKLEERFLRRTAAGYDITMAGVYVVWAIRSGTLSTATSLDPVTVEDDCPSCGASLVLSYENELLRVACSSCGRVAGMTPFPSNGLVGRDVSGLLEIYEQVVRLWFRSVVHDICPNCFGVGSLDVVTDERVLPVEVRRQLTDRERAEIAAGTPEGGYLDVVWTCSQCGLWTEAPLAVLLCFRPEIAAFYREHGVDVESIRSWDLPRHLGDCRVTVVRRDPLSLRLDTTLDDETLTVSVEDGFAAVSVERSEVSGGSPTQ
jgi:ribosomal protein S27AE